MGSLKKPAPVIRTVDLRCAGKPIGDTDAMSGCS
jgi:hypothetical protein